jgi:hypothetical protein
MNPAYLSPFANHLWQSTLFAGVTGLLTPALRRNHARVRHWVWLAASCKFLIPLSVLIALGGQIQWRTPMDITPSHLSVVMDEVSQPFTAPAVSSPLRATTPPPENSLSAILLGAWACGFLGIACAWGIRWRRIRAAVRAASPVQLELPIRAMFFPSLLEPGVFGVFRPVLLLPEGIFDRLTPAQLEAVIAHELCHVRRRDNLIAAIHMFVETLFWFSSSCVVDREADGGGARTRLRRRGFADWQRPARLRRGHSQYLQALRRIVAGVRLWGDPVEPQIKNRGDPGQPKRSQTELCKKGCAGNRRDSSSIPSYRNRHYECASGPGPVRNRAAV